jgi:hypothetical protein
MIVEKPPLGRSFNIANSNSMFLSYTIKLLQIYYNNIDLVL